MARTASSSRCWGSALRRESSAGAQVKRRCSWASVSWLPQLELQLGSHFTPQRRCGQGCLTTCCPNTAEGAVELVQLCLVGVQHLGSWLGFEPHLTFSCPNLNKEKLEEKRVRLTKATRATKKKPKQSEGRQQPEQPRQPGQPRKKHKKCETLILGNQGNQGNQGKNIKM